MANILKNAFKGNNLSGRSLLDHNLFAVINVIFLRPKRCHRDDRILTVPLSKKRSKKMLQNKKTLLDVKIGYFW